MAQGLKVLAAKPDNYKLDPKKHHKHNGGREMTVPSCSTLCVVEVKSTSNIGHDQRKTVSGPYLTFNP